GPVGLAARVHVPPELQHYSDRRRFLAIQMADSRQEQYELPKDDADLAAMLREGKLVEMPALAGDYILYDVGLDGADNPMAAYDPADGADRARFDTRLLSTTRPGTRDLLLEIAREYHEKFGRLLPVTSLVRTERYQRRLGRVNANATHVETPPHTTGCAFDISY